MGAMFLKTKRAPDHIWRTNLLFIMMRLLEINEQSKKNTK